MNKFVLSALVFALLVATCYGKPARSEDRVNKQEKLSDKQHYGSDGEHDDAYDQEAFLGKEQAAEFRQLTTDESKRRLGILIDKMDKDRSGKLTKEELRNGIREAQRRHAYEDMEKRWLFHDKDGDGFITYDEIIKTTYSYKAEPEHQDELFDKRRGLTYKQQMVRDKRKFGRADENKDGKLTKDEYAAYLHPYDFPHMRQEVIDRSMDDMDKDKDGYISLEEYMSDMYDPASHGPDPPEWLEREKEHFSVQRDKDKDGKLNKEELGDWVSPVNYDPIESEASHLIHGADEDHDEQLTKQEVLNHWNTFVGSQATEYGRALNRHDEF